MLRLQQEAARIQQETARVQQEAAKIQQIPQEEVKVQSAVPPQANVQAKSQPPPINPAFRSEVNTFTRYLNRELKGDNSIQHLLAVKPESFFSQLADGVLLW